MLTLSKSKGFFTMRRNSEDLATMSTEQRMTRKAAQHGVAKKKKKEKNQPPSEDQSVLPQGIPACQTSIRFSSV